jgi:nicotinamide-nucleotide adenylyltransferase
MQGVRGLFVGRFQPFHSGHEQLVESIAAEVEELVIGIGSADASHTRRNPFTAGERLVMISRELPGVDVGWSVLGGASWSNTRSTGECQYPTRVGRGT